MRRPAEPATPPGAAAPPRRSGATAPRSAGKPAAAARQSAGSRIEAPRVHSRAVKAPRSRAAIVRRRLIGLDRQQPGLLQLAVDPLPIVEQAGAGGGGFGRLRRLPGAGAGPSWASRASMSASLGVRAATTPPVRARSGATSTRRVLQRRLVETRREARLLDRSKRVLRLVDDRRLARQRIRRRLGVDGACAAENEQSRPDGGDFEWSASHLRPLAA